MLLLEIKSILKPLYATLYTIGTVKKYYVMKIRKKILFFADCIGSRFLKYRYFSYILVRRSLQMKFLRETQIYTVFGQYTWSKSSDLLGSCVIIPCNAVPDVDYYFKRHTLVVCVLHTNRIRPSLSSLLTYSANWVLFSLN